MKLKNLICFVLIFIFLFSLSLSVLGQRTGADAQAAAQRATAGLTDSINIVIDWIFGVSFVNLDAMIITLAIFIILFIMFSDALISFSPMSRNAAIAVGFFITLIISIIDGTRYLAELLLSFTLIFGVFAMVVSLLLVFISYFVLHILIFRTLLPVFRNPTKETIEDVTAGIDLLRSIGKTSKQPGRKVKKR